MEEHAVAGRARRRGAKVLALQASRAAGASLPLWAATSLRCPPPCDDVLVLLLDDRIGRQNGETMPSSLKNAPGGNGGASSLTYASGGMGGTVPS